ncbi:MAG: hypothetical protein M5U34_33025 [Chloroflexi bacterium]|nr:hypothetical protein [Chloroflexota bacterium]
MRAHCWRSRSGAATNWPGGGEQLFAGDKIIKKLKELDEVAYIRYAIVYLVLTTWNPFAPKSTVFYQANNPFETSSFEPIGHCFACLLFSYCYIFML